MLELLVEGRDAHGPHALGDQIADGIVDHRGRDARLHAEAVGQVGGAVELAAADVDLAFSRLAERDDPRIEAVDKRAEGDEIQRAFLTDIQTVLHSCSPFVWDHPFFHTVEVTLPPWPVQFVWKYSPRGLSTRSYVCAPK